ncbi:Clp protease [Mycetocola zhujimingii]|uniref:Clp protease n=2 Tax=Mycetocola zhujimingii TaxID=2079792 RepID=A0A2U1TEZ6_9MICO|nr:Clp protease [Mycetocola zhujimingii]PWC07459.1 Clp protease [Mycetocola zhujimingii]
MQVLSIAAMEEASRRGQRDADLEHLFLALVLSDQSAGRALRAAGVTLTGARDAVDAMHSDQLRAIGVAVDQPAPGRIVFHETRGYEWTPRALNLLKHAGDKGGGDAAAVLRELLAEPSGLIADLLARLSLSVDQVETALTIEQSTPPPERPADAAATPRAVTGRTEVFVPASVETVWALVADPLRMPEWNPSVGTIEPDGNDHTDTATVGSSWLAITPTVHPDGKPARVKREFRRRRVQLVDTAELVRIAWQTSYPDTTRGTANVLSIELTPAPGGTQLRLAMSWARSRGWRRIVGWPLRPLQRFLAWLGLVQIGGGISRVFR